MARGWRWAVFARKKKCVFLFQKQILFKFAVIVCFLFENNFETLAGNYIPKLREMLKDFFMLLYTFLYVIVLSCCMVNVILNCNCRVSLKIKVSNVAVFCTSRRLWCCQCWGFHLWLPRSYLISFPSFNTTGCFGALLIGPYVFPATQIAL